MGSIACARARAALQTEREFRTAPPENRKALTACNTHGFRFLPSFRSFQIHVALFPLRRHFALNKSARRQFRKTNLRDSRASRRTVRVRAGVRRAGPVLRRSTSAVQSGRLPMRPVINLTILVSAIAMALLLVWGSGLLAHYSTGWVVDSTIEVSRGPRCWLRMVFRRFWQTPS